MSFITVYYLVLCDIIYVTAREVSTAEILPRFGEVSILDEILN